MGLRRAWKLQETECMLLDQLADAYHVESIEVKLFSSPMIGRLLPPN